MFQEGQEEPATVQMMRMDPAGTGHIRMVADPLKCRQTGGVWQIRSQRKESDRGLTLLGIRKNGTQDPLVFLRCQGAGDIEQLPARGEHAEGLSKEGFL
jgi:hypothetical protein